MSKKNEAHIIVVESLTEALLQLMDVKPLPQIKVSELCKRAGVSRVSYYRNYESMEDILIQHLTKCTDEWWIEFSKKTEDDFHKTFWIELLDQYKKNEKLVKLLYKNNMSSLLKDHIFACCDIKSKDSDEEAYARAILAGAIYGLVDEWIRRGMNKLPEGFSIRKIASLML